MRGISPRSMAAACAWPAKGRRRGEQLAHRVIAVGFFLFVIAYFLPLGSKVQNNIFYGLCALPTVCWFGLHPGELLDYLKRFVWFWSCLAVLVLGALLHQDLAALKDVFYIAVLFLSLALLWRSGLHVRLFDSLAVVSIIALLAASVLWLQHWAANEPAARIFLWGELHPIRTALLVGCGLVSLWMFRVAPWIQAKSKAARFCALFVMLLLLIWCSVVFQSRSLLLGIFAFLVYELILARRAWPGLALLALISLAVWLLGWHEMLLQRGLSYRLDIWLDGWNRLQNLCGLLQGCGDDGFRFIGTYAHPHSAYWSILYANGLPIFLFVMGCLLALLVKGMRCHSRWLQVALIGWGGVFTTTGGVVHSPAEYWIYFWFPTFFAMFECSALAQLAARPSAAAGQTTDR